MSDLTLLRHPGFASLLVCASMLCMNAGCDHEQETHNAAPSPSPHAATTLRLELVPAVQPASQAMDGPTKLRIESSQAPMELELVPNHALTQGTIIKRDGKELSAHQAKLKIPYQGKVKGDPTSRVRLAPHKNGYEGLIFTEGRLFELRSDPVDPRSARFGEVNAQDYAPASDEHHAHCETRTVPENAMPAAAPKKTGRSGGCKETDIALVADHTFTQELGSREKAEQEMLNRLNEVDGIYQANLNVRFKASSIEVFPSAGGPAFNAAVSGPVTGQTATPLDDFSRWAGNNRPNADLSHLFVARTRSGTVGLAFVGALCRRSFGTGVSNYLGRGRASTVVFAHELGHNFGAGHEEQEQGVLMTPTLSPSADTFSSGSLAQIQSQLNRASCLSACQIAPEPEPEDTSAGTDDSSMDSETGDNPTVRDDTQSSRGSDDETSDDDSLTAGESSDDESSDDDSLTTGESSEDDERSDDDSSTTGESSEDDERSDDDSRATGESSEDEERSDDDEDSTGSGDEDDDTNSEDGKENPSDDEDTTSSEDESSTTSGDEDSTDAPPLAPEGHPPLECNLSKQGTDRWSWLGALLLLIPFRRRKLPTARGVHES